jgi:uncharacterized membrane protein YjgN (DUF898 family)
MAKTTVELNLSSIFGVFLLVIGIVVLGIVAVSAYLLSNGTLQPLQVAYKAQIGNVTISPETSLLFGILLQIGMFAVLVGVAYTVMRFGAMLIQRKEKE